MTSIFAVLSLITTAFWVFAIFALHILKPDIKPMVFGISFYAHGAFGNIVSIAFVLVGISGVTLALALWPTFTSTGGRAGLLLMIAWFFTQVLAGVFPVDAPGAPPTQAGKIHNLSGLNFLLIAPAVLLIELSASAVTGLVSSHPITLWLGWLLLASALLLFIFNGPLNSLKVGGAFQRFFWLVLVVWFILRASQVL